MWRFRTKKNEKHSRRSGKTRHCGGRFTLMRAAVCRREAAQWKSRSSGTTALYRRLDGRTGRNVVKCRSAEQWHLRRLTSGEKSAGYSSGPTRKRAPHCWWHCVWTRFLSSCLVDIIQRKQKDHRKQSDSREVSRPSLDNSKGAHARRDKRKENKKANCRYNYFDSDPMQIVFGVITDHIQIYPA